MTVTEFIDALGGSAKAARLFSVRCSAVSNWKARGRLPERVHALAAAIARKKRIGLPRETSARGAAR